jgi:RNA polymerase sigma-70 factor (ECF subfamily)
VGSAGGGSHLADAPPARYFQDAVDDDCGLLERLRAGDEDAFRELVARHDGALRRVARTFVHTASAADEVVQETWLGVIRGLDGFESRSSLRTWIFRILINRARTRGVRDARSVPFSALETDDGPTVDAAAFGVDGRWTSAPPRLETDPETSLLSAELREHLLRAIDELAPAQRAVITLRDLVGVSAEEVCELLELSEGNQRVLLHRARSRVRTALVPLVEVTS